MNILITGSSGFLGQHIIKEFQQNTRHALLIPTHQELDLLRIKDIYDYFDSHTVDFIIHAAGKVGGLSYNKKYPADLTYENLVTGTNIINIAARHGVEKFVFIGTTCSYPEIPYTIPFIESELFDKMPEKTNSGYGYAKRMLIKLLHEYYAQYNLFNISLIPTNLCGPGDCFNDERSHVIAAMIKKFELSQKNNETFIKLWGDGSASRDFASVKDCCRVIRLALEINIPSNEIINVGSGREVNIKELADMIKRIGGYTAEYQFTGEVGNGQPRRCLNIEKAKRLLNWEPKISLEESIRETIEWYRNQNLCEANNGK